MKYKEIVELYENLDKTTKRLEKTFLISKFIKNTNTEFLPQVVLLAQGKVFPDWVDKKIGVASKLIVKAINRATGISENEITNEWKKLGDLGLVAEKLIGKKKQSSLFPKELDLIYVLDKLKSLADMQGKGSVDDKLKILSEMFINSSPEESKYVARTAIDKLRIGIGQGSIRDAIIWAYFDNELNITYDKESNDISLDADERTKYNNITEKVQHAYDLTNDFGLIAVKLKNSGLKGLDDIKIEVFKPINVMLFQKAKDVKDAFSIVGKPAAFEYKYDGFRMSIHKKNDSVRMYTRRLEDVTEQFPEVVNFVKEHIKASECILDGEAVGYDPKSGKYLPFQSISQRIRRKYNIKEVSEKFPVEVNLFDIIYCEGKNLLKEPYIKRRKELEKITNQKEKKIVLAKQIITDNYDIAMQFYEQSLKEGEEGAMAKNLEGIYKPGSRVGYGVKIKSIMDPLDLVIVGAEYGEGKRSGMLTSFVLACSDSGDLAEIGKVSTGLKEIEGEGTTFHELSELLKPHIIKTVGKFVKIRPEIVIEVGYEEIQKSSNYSSGFALRFPRFLRLRIEEKTVDDINTIDDVESLYKDQRGRNSNSP